MRRLYWLIRLAVVASPIAVLQGQVPERTRTTPTAPDQGPTFRVGTRLGPAAASDTLVDDALGRPATKVFKPGSDVVFACDIYDWRGRRAEPFSTQTTLLRDGRPLSGRGKRATQWVDFDVR